MWKITIVFLWSIQNGICSLSCFVSCFAKFDQWCGLRHGLAPCYQPSDWLECLFAIWTVVVTLYIFWVLKKVALILISRFVLWNWYWKWCIVIKYKTGLVFYSHRPLPHCLVPLVGLRELRGVMTLLSKLVGLSCVMSTKMFLPNWLVYQLIASLLTILTW